MTIYEVGWSSAKVMHLTNTKVKTGCGRIIPSSIAHYIDFNGRKWLFMYDCSMCWKALEKGRLGSLID